MKNINHTRSSISDDIRNILCSSANMRRAIPLILRLLMNQVNLSTNLASHFFDLVIGKILTSRLSLSKHLAHNLGNLLLLGKIGVFHNRRNASSRLLLLISKHLILCIYLESFRMQGVEFDNGDMYVDGHKAASDVRDEFVSVTEKLMDELAQCYNVLPQLDINNTIDHRP